MHNLNNEKGSALLAVIIIGVLIALFSVVTLRSTSDGLHKTSSRRKNVSAINYAEAGKEHALQQLRDELATPVASSTTTIFTNETFEDGSYSVECLANAAVDTVWITSTGHYKSSSKTIRATYRVDSCAQEDIPFIISEGEVIPQEVFIPTITILGAELSYGSQYIEPITVEINIGANQFYPWGDMESPVDANVQDGTYPDVYHFPSSYSSGDAVFIRAQSWIKVSSSYDGSQNSHWQHRRNVISNVDTDRVHVLRNGDPVPDIPGYLGQQSVDVYLQDYINDNDTIVLANNQAIYLFEFTSDLESSAADFQDLVVLVTLDHEGVVVEEEQQGSCFDTVTLFSDDFENGFSGWDTDDYVWGQYDGDAKNGSYGVRVKRDGRISRIVSTAGYTNITVSFKMCAYSIEYSEKVKGRWSDGSNYYTMKEIGSGDTEEQQQLFPFSYTLPEGAENNPNFKLWFRVYAGSTGDYGYFDDIVVTGVTTVECEEEEEEGEEEQEQGSDSGTKYIPIAWEEL